MKRLVQTLSDQVAMPVQEAQRDIQIRQQPRGQIVFPALLRQAFYQEALSRNQLLAPRSGAVDLGELEGVSDVRPRATQELDFRDLDAFHVIDDAGCRLAVSPGYPAFDWSDR